MEALELEAQPREKKRKGDVKELRRKGLLPAVLYGPEIDPVSISFEARDLEKIINKSGEKAILKVKVNNEEYITLLKDIQRHPFKDEFVHCDLQQISLKDKLDTSVPIYVTGEAPGVEEGGVLQQTLREIEIRCLPINIPDYIEVDISELQFGDTIMVTDLEISDDIEITTDSDTPVVSIVAAKTIEEEEAEAEAEAEEAEEGEEEAEEGEEEAEEGEEETEEE